MRSRNLYLYGLAILLFLTVVILRVLTFNKMVAYTKQVDYSSTVIRNLDALSVDFKSAQIYSPKFQKQIAPEYYAILYDKALKVTADLHALDSLLTNHSELRSQFDTVNLLVRKHMDALMQQNIVELIESGKGHTLHDLYRVDTGINNILYHEAARLSKQEKELTEKTRQSNNVSFLLASLALLIIIFSFITNYRLSRKHTWLHGFLESLLNTSDYGVMAYEAVRNDEKQIINFKILYANPAIERIVGVKPNVLINKTVDNTGTFVSKLLFKKYVEVVETGEKINTEINVKDNWYNVVITKLKDGCSASFHEISEIKQYQRDLESTIKKLEKTNVELEQYAYAASHDLQEPLRKITTFSTILWNKKKDVFDEKDKQFFEKIISSANRMAKLIHDLLSFSSLKKEAEFVKVDLNESLSTVIEDLDLMIVQKKAVIHSESLPVIEAIPSQMNQLFYNLLNNALKFSYSERTPEITIRSKELQEEEIKTYADLIQGIKYFQIEVSDNGVGFDNEYASNIFGLFKQLHPKEVYKGSGIGLSLCQRVADNHHGVIYARGVEKKGATFYVLLPEKQPNSNDVNGNTK